jgi:hypothetical protein
MAITLHLTPEQEAKLRSVAGQLKVSPEALAEAAVRDLLTLPDDAFLKVAPPELREGERVHLTVERVAQGDIAGIEAVARGAALSRLRAGIDSMNFCSSGGLPSRDEIHDRS